MAPTVQHMYVRRSYRSSLESFRSSSRWRVCGYSIDTVVLLMFDSVDYSADNLYAINYSYVPSIRISIHPSSYPNHL
jgi:hypothetical protein